MTLEELQAKLELWKGAWPKLTKNALSEGSDVIKKEIERRYIGGPLHMSKNSGVHLARSVRTIVKLNPLTAKIEVDSKQQYKAQTHEYGKELTPKRGKYLAIPFWGTWNERALGNINKRLAKNNLRTYGADMRKVTHVTIPARPIFGPVRQQKHQVVLDLIRDTIYKAYDKGAL